MALVWQNHQSHLRVELEKANRKITQLKQEIERYKKICADYRSFRCVCKFDDNDEVIEMCGAHKPIYDQLKQEIDKRNRLIADIFDDMECLDGCDSYGHEELCPNTNGMAAFTKLRQEIEQLKQELADLNSHQEYLENRQEGLVEELKECYNTIEQLRVACKWKMTGQCICCFYNSGPKYRQECCSSNCPLIKEEEKHDN